METGKTHQRSREQTTPICCDHCNIEWKPGFINSDFGKCDFVKQTKLEATLVKHTR